MKSSKKQNLIKEQNKSLIMICVVILLVIGIVGVMIYLPSSKSNESTNNFINDNGVVDDLDGIRAKK